MTEDQKEILRDDIALIIGRNLHARYGLDSAFSRQIADAIVLHLFEGGGYHVTAEGLDYLAAHRLALSGGRVDPFARVRGPRRLDHTVTDHVSYKLCVHGYRVCSECGGPNVVPD